MRVLPFGRNIIDPDERSCTRGSEEKNERNDDSSQWRSPSLSIEDDGASSSSVFFSHSSLARSSKPVAPTVSLPPPPEPEVTLVTKLHTPNPVADQAFWGGFVNKCV